MNGKMIISLALVSMMVMGAFGMMMPKANAQIVNMPNDRDIVIWSSTIDNYDPFGNDFWMKPIFLGDQNVNFNIVIRNNGGDGMTDDNPIEWANLSISTTIRNAAGASVTTPISNWDVNRVDDEADIWDWNQHTFNGFQFDVKANAVPGVYNLTVTLDYKTNIGTPATYIGYILFEIRNRVEVPNVGGLKPGDLNVKKNFGVGFDNNMPGTVEDISISITLPDTGFTWFGVSGSTITKTTADTFQSWNTWNIQLIMSVSNSKDKGVYTGQYSVTYRIAGVQYTETGTVDFTVGHLPMLDVSVGTATIAQGTTKVNWTLTFTNVGTVDLLDIKLQLDDASEDFTFVLADHWEGDDTVSYSWLELGDINKGATVTRSMEVGIDLYIPKGIHKMMFMFWGMYYDPDTATYDDVIVDWTMGAFGNVPRVNFVALDPDSSTVKGPYIDITVTDTQMDVMLTSTVTLNAGGRTLDNALTLNVNNFGNIDYANVILRIETNTATSPFLNVVSPTATLSEEAPVSDTLWGGYDRLVTLQVSLKPDAELGVYMVPVTVTGINKNMGEVVSTVIDARITIRGVGPQLEVTTVAPETVKAGKAFTLSVTFTNLGDDTARNIIINSADWFDDQETTIDGNYAQPQPNALPLFIGDLAPGATVTVEIPMMANSDMSGGHVYSMLFSMNYVDSFGYGPSTDTFQVSVKSSGMGGSVLGMLYWSFVLLAIIVAIFLIILAVFYVKKNKKPKVAPEQQYNQPPPPPEQMMQP